MIAEPSDLSKDQIYAKERRLVEEVRSELAQGRRCQIYAVYTQKWDVTRRLEGILMSEGIKAALLTTDVPPEGRESWYDRQLRAGIQVVICHPKLVQTGLDLIEFPTILFYETGYSIYVFRQASRRSWRIGQRLPVKVKCLHYAETMQESCLRLMGKKLLVSLAMEGKFSSEGLQAINEEDDLLMVMARELVTEKGIGERADAVWASLQKQKDEVLGTRKLESADAAGAAATSEIPPTIPSSVTVDQWPAQATATSQSPRGDSRRKTPEMPEGQLSLF